MTMLDDVALAVHLDRALLARGVVAGTRRARTFAEVLRVLPPRTAGEAYWRARVAMLPSVDDLDAFDAAFVDVFGALALRQAQDDGETARRESSAATTREGTLRRETLPPPPSERPAGEKLAEQAPTQWVVASSERRLAETAFEELDDDERAAILRLIARVRVAAEGRLSRRRRRHARGDRFDFRGTLRGAARTAGELVRRAATRRRERLRPVVFLLDVSGSMAPFARALIQYAHVTALARPAVRAFAFATQLTDLTPLLKRADDEHLMGALGAAVRDYGGGTRIGAALRAFNDRFGQRGIARGGTVVILSDGWERDDPALVAREMLRLRRLARRIVWVNPHKRHPAYEPLARGMAAALPYLDAFLSGHSLRTLEAVADAIEGRDA
ncbi:MAG: VWA domain-containing protein [Candidatus Eremiobacteraeota bacterium]|nr:VWA domain-containing protein [Candidatus Eremiobacteraeota bacterium]MBV9407566.1 VWA domain-containing protein [Candidatus Eremiobacteraeota bacterium]